MAAQITTAVATARGAVALVVALGWHIMTARGRGPGSWPRTASERLMLSCQASFLVAGAPDIIGRQE
jgi:hypothetical protein